MTDRKVPARRTLTAPRFTEAELAELERSDVPLDMQVTNALHNCCAPYSNQIIRRLRATPRLIAVARLANEQAEECGRLRGQLAILTAEENPDYATLRKQLADRDATIDSLCTEREELRKYLLGRDATIERLTEQLTTERLARAVIPVEIRLEAERDDAMGRFAMAKGLADQARRHWQYPPARVAEKEERDEWDRVRAELDR